VLGDEQAAYDRLPYFYSDQYDLGLEYAGRVGPEDEARVVVRGDLATREFVAFWLDAQDHVLAAMNVNVWDVLDEIRPLIEERVVVDPVRLADPAVAYAEVAAG
jgi:3-phenylpropionate/trans-cinnamate dioxygenase ferredoxin reductase component